MQKLDMVIVYLVLIQMEVNLIMSSLRNEALLETLFEEVWEELVTPNFKQLEAQDVTILEEYVGTIAQQRFEDCSR